MDSSLDGREARSVTLALTVNVSVITPVFAARELYHSLSVSGGREWELGVKARI